MTTKHLLNAFAGWSAEHKPLVLASVFETEGSTYSKAGAQMLITTDGHFQGMLSGGCLEGDLAERAHAVIKSGVPQSVTYDLGKNDEELWGLGVGCDGLMRIFLQPLLADDDYEPFASMAKAFAGDDVQFAATVLESSLENLAVGAALVKVDSLVAFSSIVDDYIDPVKALATVALREKRSISKEVGIDDGVVKLLITLLQPPPEILVLGAGLDAEPVVRLASELGWRVTIQDHRPAYIESGNFVTAEHIHCMPVDEISASLDLDGYAATIVMSHHLASDRQYLRQLAGSHIEYIGLLGPGDRRRRLLEELGDLSDSLESRVHGPAGLDLGGRGPASIALSIIAEMHQYLMRRQGG
ncbi:MAG: XdhC/CoxI family protein [Gammaproteobacteria bacterium]|nr:MAG: XdhC/CoxI family protein [Gammaproteobacteria bacterium]RLA29800.1 MAG: XdhC/CoxI family protein [Gammaproteobacteria bacterium]